MTAPRILIVEDDASIRDLCREVLESEGFEVQTCDNGRQALTILDGAAAPCLILLDMVMPIMDGRQFMLEFEKKPHVIAPIPVYLVSATSVAREGREMGCCGFLKKPFSIEALLAIVHEHCRVNEISKVA